MEKEGAGRGWRTTAKIFIALFILLGLFLFWYILRTNGISDSLTSCYEQNNKAYEDCQKQLAGFDYKCPDGTDKACIEKGKYYQTYKDTEYFMTYDKIQQTATVCNKVDNRDAQCVLRGASCLKCPSNAYAGCYDNTGKWVRAEY